MTTRTVRVSGSEPSQSAAIRGYRESQNFEKTYSCENKMQKRGSKNSMQNPANVSETTAS
eukprot:458071-Pleurochrysis_carterae.AAC.1